MWGAVQFLRMIYQRGNQFISWYRGDKLWLARAACHTPSLDTLTLCPEANQSWRKSGETIPQYGSVVKCKETHQHFIET